MSICYLQGKVEGSPAEARLLEEVTVRLIEPEQRDRYDELMEREHYLHNANAVGAVLRYVAEYRGEWVGLLTFCSAALHLKARDRFLQWSAREVPQRRYLVARNSRFLILPARDQWPNLASRLLKLVCERLPADWEERFGHPVLLAETFVDPQRFRGTCYQGAGWQALGRTRGFERHGQDYYLDTQHPKELWVRELAPGALEGLRAEELDPELEGGGEPLAPPVPVATSELDSLWAFLRRGLTDPRDRHGVRYPLASVIGIATLATGAGCQGPHAIGKFARSLNRGQRRRLRCRPRPGHPRQFDVPCERTFDRLLKGIDPEQLRRSFSEWMASLDPEPVEVLHLDGKVLKHTEDTRYGVTGPWPEEADPAALLREVRGYWAIETKQHYRRDYTQREDHCRVRNSTSARNPSLMRSAAIFLYERRRTRRNGEQSLPDWQSKNHRDPNPLIRLLVRAPG